MINAYYFYILSHWLYKKHIPLLPKLITLLIFLIYNSKIPASAELGKGTRFGYGGIGVVVHGRTVVGKNCAIAPRVTIGGRSGHKEVPVIGDNVRISTGSCVLGPIRIGNNAIKGANAVVINDVPDNAVVVGVPAKIIRINSVVAQ